VSSSVGSAANTGRAPPSAAHQPLVPHRATTTSRLLRTAATSHPLRTVADSISAAAHSTVFGCPFVPGENLKTYTNHHGNPILFFVCDFDLDIWV
jgi:hypothetical protein